MLRRILIKKSRYGKKEDCLAKINSIYKHYKQEHKMNHNGIFSLSFPEAKTIIVSGDIHGDFNQLVFKLCI